MTIQDLGSVGELIAAIATIATLFYLARQVRANTKASQTASRVEITRDMQTLVTWMFEPEIATPGGSRWWQTVGRPIYTAKMVAAVDACVVSGEHASMILDVYPLPEADTMAGLAAS